MNAKLRNNLFNSNSIKTLMTSSRFGFSNCRFTVQRLKKLFATIFFQSYICRCYTKWMEFTINRSVSNLRLCNKWLRLFSYFQGRWTKPAQVSGDPYQVCLENVGPALSRPRNPIGSQERRYEPSTGGRQRRSKSSSQCMARWTGFSSKGKKSRMDWNSLSLLFVIVTTVIR